MPNKADSENDVILEMHHVGNDGVFYASTIVFSVILKMKFARKQLLKKLRGITRRHQKTREAMRMTRLSVNE
jgi:hypothetical protein